MQIRWIFLIISAHIRLSWSLAFIAFKSTDNDNTLIGLGLLGRNIGIGIETFLKKILIRCPYLFEFNEHLTKTLKFKTKSYPEIIREMTRG